MRLLVWSLSLVCACSLSNEAPAQSLERSILDAPTDVVRISFPAARTSAAGR